MLYVHVFRFANGKGIKDNSVVATFPRMISPKINKVTVRARAQPEDKATPAEIRSLRECNGAVQWVAKESRPDLAVQVSLSQQALSDPRVRHCRQANAMVRRAKQHHRDDMAFSSNTIGKHTVGDAFRCGLSERSRVSITSWLQHFGD